VRPSKVDNSSGWESRSGKAGQPIRFMQLDLWVSIIVYNCLEKGIFTTTTITLGTTRFGQFTDSKRQ